MKNRKKLSEQIVELRRAGIDYHTSVIGHGVITSELKARVRRVEQQLKLPSLSPMKGCPRLRSCCSPPGCCVCAPVLDHLHRDDQDLVERDPSEGRERGHAHETDGPKDRAVSPFTIVEKSRRSLRVASQPERRTDR
jgi:hypothetical protein